MADKATEAPTSTPAPGVDNDQERGYIGDTVDETPRERYTLAGVVAAGKHSAG